MTFWGRVRGEGRGVERGRSGFGVLMPRAWQFLSNGGNGRHG